MKGINKPKKESFIKTRYVIFGTKILNHYQLEKNILLIKYPKTIAPTVLKRTIISDKFKSLIIDLLNTQKINIELQKQLDLKEIELFEKLLRICGIFQTLNYKRYEMSMIDIINRFEVLRGGLIAGNHSFELRTELIEIIKKLVYFNKISVTDSIELIEIII